MLTTKSALFRRAMMRCLLLSGIASLSGFAFGAPAEHSQVVAVSLPGQSFPAHVQPYFSREIKTLYVARQNAPMWQDRAAVQHFQQQLAELALSGVQPQFTSWAQWLTDPLITDLARDKILSDAMLGYLQFTNGVGANGERWLYGNTSYQLALPPRLLIDRWQNALNEGQLDAFVSGLVPQHPQYPKMNQALKAILAENHPWPQLTGSASLRTNQLSDDIPALREILQRTGMLQPGDAAPLPTVDAALANPPASQPVSHDPPPAVVTTVDVKEKMYSPDLVSAVKRFQKWQGLGADGVIGRQTRNWLNVSPQTRITLLALNIQRLRFLNNRINTGILVNIPNYSLVYYQQGEEVFTSRVIVGRPSRKTPLLRSVLSSVVLNPPWNVPTSLVRQDILPKALRDPGYLPRNDFTILSDWKSDTAVINPTSIDWNIVTPHHFPYRLQQAPGPKNALGRYKFNMPSSDAIYLHDTPNHNLFGQDQRALSSGCVRVHKAAVLANLLLQDAGWGYARVRSTLKQGNTIYVPIRHQIPVNLFYLTAWVAEDGKPQFRTDIYNYDRPSQKGARSLPQAQRLLQ